MRVVTIIQTDLKNILRDRTLIIILFIPLMFIALLRIVPPIYESFFPETIIYRPLILAALCLVSTSMAGFLLAFVMLDEKDQHLFQVFQVMPVSFNRLIQYRMGTIIVSGFIFSVILILGSDFVKLSTPEIILFSLLCSLSGPANTLLIVSLANNKIEGMTYFKLLSFFMILPLIALFITHPARLVAGIIPFYWVFASLWEAHTFVERILPLSIGILIHLLYISAALYLFMRRNQT